MSLTRCAPRATFGVTAAFLAAGCGGGDAGPARLSETGLYADAAGRVLAPGVVRFTPRHELWSDGAAKERFLLVPSGARIDTEDWDAWRFPVGTKLWKTFRVDGRLVETRLLHKRREPDDGGWFQMAYRWRDDERDADAVPRGERDSRGTAHDVPSQEDCGQCHYRGEKPVIGLTAVQLGGDDLQALAPLMSAPATQPYRVPGDGPVAAALGYLDVNCGPCHNSRSAAAKSVRIHTELHVTDRTPEETSTYRTTLGALAKHAFPAGVPVVVEPGDPEHSQLLARMATREPFYLMPPYGTEVVDAAGLSLVRAWIASLPRR